MQNLKQQRLPLVLASSSESRLKLLRQIGIYPDMVLPSNIPEIAHKGESGKMFAVRLAQEKALAVAAQIGDAIIIGSDTVPVCGRTIMHKAENAADVRRYLSLVSGRRHRVYTGIAVVRVENNKTQVIKRAVETSLKFKRLTEAEIEYYVSTGEGVGKAGGYTLFGYAESFVSFISGSFSNVVGLPLHETMNLLNSVGVKPCNQEAGRGILQRGPNRAFETTIMQEGN